MKIENAKIRDGSSVLGRTSAGSRTSVFSSDRRSEISYISVDQLIPYHKQARQIFDQEEIDQLALTIQEHGIRQPLTVLRADINTAEFEVISGERRLRAAKQIGIKQVPCIIINDLEKAEEIALIENVQRQDLHPVELSMSLKLLVEKHGRGGQLEVGKKVGLSKSQMSELIKVADLPEDVKKILLDYKVRGRELYRKIISIKDDRQRLIFVKSITNQSEKKEGARLSSKASSVLRISVSEDTFKIQKSNISKLNAEQKKALRVKILELLQELS